MGIRGDRAPWGFGGRRAMAHAFEKGPRRALGTFVKVFCNMIPFLCYGLPSGPKGLAKVFFLCGTSHPSPDYSGNLKNLAVAVEPPASPTRPTLRDGQ